MYILHIIASMDPITGGPCQGIRNLEKAGWKGNVIREVVCLDAPGSSYLNNETLTIHAIGAGRGAWHYEPHLLAWLKDNIRRFDVIVINGLWLYHSYALWKVMDNLKKCSSDEKLIRVFVMPHGMLDPYFQRTKERWLKAMRNWLYWKLVERKVVNDADGLLFTCETELLLARETFKPYHPKKEYNIGYGIEAPPEYQQIMTSAFIERCGGLETAPYLLFLSRIHPKKGVDILIKAYKALAIQHAKMPKLVIAGPGLETDYGKKIQKMVAQDQSLKEGIIFTGMLTGDAKWGALYGCEAFILPSHQENFGIAVAESLACYRAVLISKQVNIWREIEAAGAGFINDDNLEGIINLLKKWIEITPEEKEIMGNAAHACYEKNFAIENSANSFLNAISPEQ